MGPDLPMRSYFKIYYHEGVFFEHEPADWKPVENGGNDQLFAVTIWGPDPNHRKRYVTEYLNQIIPYASDTAGAIAVSMIGFNDYKTYHELFPNG